MYIFGAPIESEGLDLLKARASRGLDKKCMTPRNKMYDTSQEKKIANLYFCFFVTTKCLYRFQMQTRYIFQILQIWY